MALYMCIQYNYQQQKGHSLERIPLTKAHHLISASEVTTVWHYRNSIIIIIFWSTSTKPVGTMSLSFIITIV